MLHHCIRWLKRCLTALTAIGVMLLAACTPYYDDYIGTWVGIDESNPRDVVLYEYEIVTAGADQYAIKLMRSHYEIDQTYGAVWTSTPPRFLMAQFDPEAGILQAPFGQLTFSTSKGTLQFGNITFVRKAKNTELKFKYVARRVVERLYPQLPITD